MNILAEITAIYATLMSVILAGILNMLFVKTGLFRELYVPMDGGRVMRDGRRIFGDNKTWKGFIGMVFFGGVSQVLWGLLCVASPHIMAKNQLYALHGQSLLFDLLAGLLFGLAYALFELPNSFIKRRLDISCGKTAKGLKGAVFYIVDQIDSLIGVVLCLSLLCPVSPAQYLLYIIVGFFTHSAVNLILYSLRIRRNI